MQNIPTSIWSILSGLPLIPSSKSAAESWLSLAELSLVFFAFVIGLGLVAEDRAERKETKWIPANPGWNWKRIFACVVAGGVIAELFSDGAIWISSDALQTISDGEILELNEQIAPRRLDPTQRAAIAKKLASFAGKQVAISSYMLDIDGAVLAAQIVQSLKPWIFVDEARLASVAGGAGSIQLGVHVTGKDAAFVKALLDAIGEYQKVSDQDPFPNFSASFGVTVPSGAPPADANVFVGVKPIEMPQ